MAGSSPPWSTKNKTMKAKTFLRKYILPDSNKRSQFLNDVALEIEALKKNATKEELARLGIDWFNPQNTDRCIYGQLTGNCATLRAKELMDEACVRSMNIGKYNKSVITVYGCDIDDKIFNINGPYSGQTWGDPSFVNGGLARNYSYLSALEGYILTDGANNKGILAYLKGETDKFPKL